ncbi:MAG: type III pantothenate kinase [Actinomycetota bacterium]|nr:type III pantothenate kinase [Actinomycetota bacterium]
MLLAVDVGNTETVLGIFRDEDLAWHWRASTVAERTPDELALLFEGLLEHRDLSFGRNVTGVVISSVVPAATQSMREMVRRYFHFEPLVVGPGTKTGIPVRTDNPKEVGADRVVNALAALSRFGAPAIVVDFGTATNFDVVSPAGEYVGGAIAPGLEVSAHALYERTARLLRVEIAAPPSVVGKNTVEAVQSGLVFGYASLVDGMVERLSKEVGSPTVVATGGLAALLVEHCRTVDHHEPWLTLEGLRLVYERNAAA